MIVVHVVASETVDIVAKAEGTTRDAVLYAAFVARLHRYTEQHVFALTVSPAGARYLAVAPCAIWGVRGCTTLPAQVSAPAPTNC
jgi:hypothetical protein